MSKCKILARTHCNLRACLHVCLPGFEEFCLCFPPCRSLIVPLYEEDGIFVADGMGFLAAVLVAPDKPGAAFQTHDSTLAIILRAGLALSPVGFIDLFLVQPVPLPGLWAPTHAKPHVPQLVILHLHNFVVDMALELCPVEAHQLQVVVLAVLQGFSPAICLFSDF